MKTNTLFDEEFLKKKWRSNAQIRLVEEVKKRYFLDDRLIKDLEFGDGRYDDQKILKAVLGSKNYINCLRLAEVASWASGNIVEFGTNLGVSSAYLSIGISVRSTVNKSNLVFTGDCSRARLNLAKELHSSAGMNNLQYIHGYFSDTCPSILEEAGTDTGLVFVDGDHTYEGTKYLYNKIMLYLPKLSIMIFDDIDWSVEMRCAWNEIRSSHADYKVHEIDGVGFLFSEDLLKCP